MTLDAHRSLVATALQDDGHLLITLALNEGLQESATPLVAIPPNRLVDAARLLRDVADDLRLRA